MTAKTMAEVLAQHEDCAFSASGILVCSCGVALEPNEVMDDLSNLATHQADVLSAAGFGLAADAKAEALEEAAKALERFDRIAATPVNRVTPEEEAEYVEFQRTNGDINWLRARAAAVRGEG